MDIVLYNLSHRQPMKKLIHKSTFSTVSIPADCVMIYSYGLYHGHRKSTKEAPLSNVSTFIQLVNESYNNVHYFEKII